MELFLKIRVIFSFASLIPFIIGILKYKYLNKGLKILFYQICIGAFTDRFQQLIIYLGYTTLWTSNFYIPIEFILVSLMYNYYFEDFIPKKHIYILIGAFTICSVINSVFLQDLESFSNYTMSIRSLIFIFYSIILFYKLIINSKIVSYWDEPVFFINIAILFLHSSMLFIYSLSNYILKFPQNTAIYILGSPPFFYGIGYILMAIGFLKIKKQS